MKKLDNLTSKAFNIKSIFIDKKIEKKTKFVYLYQDNDYNHYKITTHNQINLC